MEHAKDDRHLHLDGIGEGELVLLGEGPSGVLTEGVSAGVVDLSGIGLPIERLSESRVVPGIISSDGHIELVGLRSLGSNLSE